MAGTTYPQSQKGVAAGDGPTGACEPWAPGVTVFAWACMRACAPACKHLYRKCVWDYLCVLINPNLVGKWRVSITMPRTKRNETDRKLKIDSNTLRLQGAPPIRALPLQPALALRPLLPPALRAGPYWPAMSTSCRTSLLTTQGP